VDINLEGEANNFSRDFGFITVFLLSVWGFTIVLQMVITYGIFLSRVAIFALKSFFSQTLFSGRALQHGDIKIIVNK